MTSSGMPVFWEMSAMGLMSLTCVRAAAAGRILSLLSTISRVRRVTSSTARGPEPGRPMSAYWMPRPSIKCRILSLSSIFGSTTDGDWMPSRRDSSKNVTRSPRTMGRLESTRFQS